MSLPKFACLNGKIVDWSDATIHAFSPVAKYGLGVFEGLRGYWNDQRDDLYLFRVKDHNERLLQSQTAMRFDDSADPEDLRSHLIELLRANNFREPVHIRMMVFLDGPGEMSATGPLGTVITALPRTAAGAEAPGINVQTSSWTRMPDMVMPARIKCNANYHNSRLALIQAKVDGYDAPLILNSRGKISEGPAMCFFLVRDGRLITPHITSDILESITRDTVLKIATERLNVVVEEREIDRSEVYISDEAFFCGTGAEITPIASVDRIPLGDGQVGPLTQRIRKLYSDLVHGISDYRSEWLTSVYK